MSAANPGPGRPPGIDPASLEKGRKFVEWHDLLGVPLDRIIELSGLKRTRVTELIALARATDNPAPASPDSKPKLARQMSEGTLLRRAWITMHVNGRLRVIDAAARLLWLETVMAIRAEGDGLRLLFAECGYEGRADFVEAFGGSEKDLALLGRRRVLDLDGEGVAIPPGLGLMPRERIGGTVPNPRRVDPRQMNLPPTVLRGGLAESGETPISADSESGKNPHFQPISPDSESAEIGVLPDSESAEIPISLDAVRLARAADADAKDLESKTLSISISSETPARESGEMPILPDTKSGKTPILPDSESGEITLEADSRLASLLTEVRALAGMEGSANASDLGTMEGWLAHHSSDAIRKLVTDTMAKRLGKRVNSLRYFARAFDEARLSRDRPAAAPDPVAPAQPPAAPAVALSAEEQAIKDRLASPTQAWLSDINGCPMPPSLVAFKAGCSTAEPAQRWLVCWEAWRGKGCPADLKPPSFNAWSQNRATYEARMLEIEDELTAPDQPATG